MADQQDHSTFPPSWRGFASIVLPLLAVAACQLAGCSLAHQRRVAFTTEVVDIEGLPARKLTSQHFIIYSSLQDPELERAMPGFMESAFARYETSFPEPATEPIRLTNYLFASRNQWLAYVTAFHENRASVYRKIRAGGFTEGTKSVSFFSDRSSTLATMAHEGWHQYLYARAHAQQVPAWLNEGLACYHEAFYMDQHGPVFTPRENNFRIGSLRRSLQSNELLPLGEIVDTDAGKVISENHSIVTQTYYAQAWALVTFLQHGDGGKHKKAFRTMMQEIADGTFAQKSQAAQLQSGRRHADSFGEAVFTFYFAQTPEELTGAYYEHIVDVCGF